MSKVRTWEDDHKDWMRARTKKFEDTLRKIANHPTGGAGCNPEGFVKMAREVLEEKWEWNLAQARELVGAAVENEALGRWDSAALTRSIAEALLNVRQLTLQEAIELAGPGENEAWSSDARWASEHIRSKLKERSST